MDVPAFLVPAFLGFPAFLPEIWMSLLSPAFRAGGRGDPTLTDLSAKSLGS